MKRAIDETERRRRLQVAYNKKHKITPATIKKKIKSIVDHEIEPKVNEEYIEIENFEDIPKVIKAKEQEMKEAARNLKFEEAAMIRDEITELKKLVSSY